MDYIRTLEQMNYTTWNINITKPVRLKIEKKLGLENLTKDELRELLDVAIEFYTDQMNKDLGRYFELKRGMEHITTIIKYHITLK